MKSSSLQLVEFVEFENDGKLLEYFFGRLLMMVD